MSGSDARATSTGAVGALPRPAFARCGFTLMVTTFGSAPLRSSSTFDALSPPSDASSFGETDAASATGFSFFGRPVSSLGLEAFGDGGGACADSAPAAELLTLSLSRCDRPVSSWALGVEGCRARALAIGRSCLALENAAFALPPPCLGVVPGALPAAEGESGSKACGRARCTRFTASACDASSQAV
eukprot:CAMPEP_0178453598 /NCGR_PEP_ID=MMETSP0689_2-20121128/44898_1 /TAXON_ID=160604 /ORGANISM="Amphidinium massartii, Strain CS-259" /LENGTH=186 /DNA_ID=CAMNT_0020079451 /DNA_START=865 /DNA_END=1421 /DNA_ORIENTATION=-